MNDAKQFPPVLRICPCCGSHLGNFNEMEAWLTYGPTMRVRVRVRMSLGRFYRLSRWWTRVWKNCALTERQVAVLRSEQNLEVEIIKGDLQ